MKRRISKLFVFLIVATLSLSIFAREDKRFEIINLVDRDPKKLNPIITEKQKEYNKEGYALDEVIVSSYMSPDWGGHLGGFMATLTFVKKHSQHHRKEKTALPFSTGIDAGTQTQK